MPNPRDLFATLAGGKRFTRLDMKQTYQQMKVDKESQKYDHKHQQGIVHLYENAVWPKHSTRNKAKRHGFGIAGVPWVICYLDDILIVGDSNEQHEERG